MEDLRVLEWRVSNELALVNLKMAEITVEKHKKTNKDKVLCELELIELEGKEKAYRACLELIKTQIQQAEQELEDLKIFEVNEPETYGLI